jgi:hypothetical protein
MAEVSDPNGVQWSVHRTLFRWWEGDDVGGGTPEAAVFYLVVGVVIWPFWIIAKWLGVPWEIVIERAGRQAGAERVRGWNKSERRIQEIAESVAAGTWRPVDDYVNRFTGVSPPPRTELYLYDSRGPAIAQLELTDRTVRCTVKGKRGYARWLSERLEIPDLKKRLKDGQQVTVFEFPRYSCDITWPEWTPRGACVQVRQGDAPVWFLAFSLPGRVPVGSENKNYLAGTCQQWREALSPTGLQH